MAKRSGKFGKVMSGATALCITSWKAKHMVGEEDVTDTCSEGKGESLDTIERIEWTIEAFWDTVTNPYTTPPNLVPGVAGGIDLYVNKDDADPLYEMPATFINDISVDLSVPSAVKYTITGKSQGDFTVNGG
jgi:hypothetical protein